MIFRYLILWISLYVMMRVDWNWSFLWKIFGNGFLWSIPYSVDCVCCGWHHNQLIRIWVCVGWAWQKHHIHTWLLAQCIMPGISHIALLPLLLFVPHHRRLLFFLLYIRCVYLCMRTRAPSTRIYKGSFTSHLQPIKFNVRHFVCHKNANNKS